MSLVLMPQGFFITVPGAATSQFPGLTLEDLQRSQLELLYREGAPLQWTLPGESSLAGGQNV